MQGIAAVRGAVLNAVGSPAPYCELSYSYYNVLCACLVLRVQDIAAVRDAVLDAAGSAWQSHICSDYQQLTHV